MQYYIESSKMAQNYFGQYLVLSQNGNQITQSDADQIAQNAISSSDLVIQAKLYTTKDINVKPTNTQNISVYFNALGTSFSNNDVIIQQSELDILNRAVVSEKKSDIDKLDPIILGYKQILADLQKMSVPSEAVNLHLELLNNTNIVATDVENMKSTLSDPIKGLIGIKRFQGDYSDCVCVY